MPEQTVTEKLEIILENISVIESYMESIQAVNDFYKGNGAMIFDAILMRLQVLGENIKSLYKLNPLLLTDIEDEVISIIRFRDLISHHYEKLDTDIVYEICTQYIPLLYKKIKVLLNTLR